VNLMPLIAERKVDDQLAKLTGTASKDLRAAWLATITK
jgi:hypothetical protein